jgi:hypothetical protein
VSCICESPPGSRPAGRPALADHARAEAERHALQTTIKSQTAELAQVRKARESLSADLSWRRNSTRNSRCSLTIGCG